MQERADFGIRVGSLAEEWFTAPSLKVKALYFPGFGSEDAGLDMGEYCITETAAIGAMAYPESHLAIPKILGLDARSQEL